MYQLKVRGNFIPKTYENSLFFNDPDYTSIRSVTIHFYTLLSLFMSHISLAYAAAATGILWYISPEIKHALILTTITRAVATMAFFLEPPVF